jgi:dTDP-4-amino-4,6-dideoxygalactose transaminase
MTFDVSEPLAAEGGPKGKRTPFPLLKRHGNTEKRYLSEVIDSDMLFYYRGTKVYEFQRRFASMYGRKHCIACSSGTAAVHMALGAMMLPPGSEVITSAITDMGTLTGILYQGLVPVFADVDAETLNLDPASVRELINDRTRAIIVVHHAGLAADMDSFLSLSREAGIPLIEDCAQAYYTRYKGRLVGSMTPLSCFSLNHFKHITCGSGGMVLTDDDRLRYLASLFLDKCYQREEGIRNPFFLAPNYQMTELQGAVALAQLDRVEEVARNRNRLGTMLNGLLANVEGVVPQKVPEGYEHTYFHYLFRLDRSVLACSTIDFATLLTAEGVPAKAREITGGRPVYLYNIFQKRSAFPESAYPFCCLDTCTDRTYLPGSCPRAEAAFEHWVTMDLYENYLDNDIEEVAFAIQKVAHHLAVRQRLVSTQVAGKGI